MRTVLLGALAAALSISCSGKSANPVAGTGGASGGSSSAGTGGRQTGGQGGDVSATGGASATGGQGAGGAAGGGSPLTGGSGGVSIAGGRSGSGGRSTASGGSATGGRSTASGGSATGGSGEVPDGGGLGGVGGTGTERRDAGSLATGGAGGGMGTGTPGGDAGGSVTDGGTLSAGCGKAVNRPDPKKQQTMTVNGTTRYYLLDVPSSADNKTPLMLIFGLHGYDMNNVAVIDRYNFNSRSGGKAITVLPYGEGPAPGDVSHWGDQVLKSTWNGNEANYNFIRTLMTDLEDRYCIDKNRVFIAGFSMGGFFTNALACAHSDWFRAFAPISGGVSGTSCSDPNAKPPIMIHHGTADTIVQYSSGESTRDYWTKQNGCSQTSKSSYTGCVSYDGCAQPVTFCTGSWDHDITQTVTGNVWTFFSGLQ
jgi:polyhydroxybutyrate depolymerase